MARNNIYIPTFPYRGAQILITSDRVVIHSKSDAVFLFGNKAIALSSPGRVNIDSGGGVTINAPVVELGLLAKNEGEPVTKATTLVKLLQTLINDLQKVSNSLGTIGLDSDGYVTANVAAIGKSTETLSKTCTLVSGSLNTIKSTISYTR